MALPLERQGLFILVGGCKQKLKAGSGNSPRAFIDFSYVGRRVGLREYTYTISAIALGRRSLQLRDQRSPIEAVLDRAVRLAASISFSAMFGCEMVRKNYQGKKVNGSRTERTNYYRLGPDNQGARAADIGCAGDPGFCLYGVQQLVKSN